MVSLPALLIAAFVAVGAVAPTPSEQTQIVGVSTAPDGAVAIDVTVPFSAAGRTLGADAFTVDVAGSPTPVTATRWTEEGLVVDVVVAAPTAPDTLADQQGALIELVDQLPANVAVRLVTTDGIGPAGTDRDATLSALRSLPPGATAPIDQLLGLAAAAPIGDAPRAAVAVPRTADARVDGYRAVLAVPPSDGEGTLLDHADLAVRRLLAGYRLTVASDVAASVRPGAALAVSVATPDGFSQVTGTTPTAPPPSTPAAPIATTAPPADTAAPAATADRAERATAAVSNDEGSATWPWVALAGGGVALAGAVALLLRRRRTVDTEVAPAAEPLVVLPPPAPPAPAAGRSRTVDPLFQPGLRPVPEATPAAAPDEEPLVRAAAAADLALSMLHSYRTSSPQPIGRAVAVAVEAAASAWIDDDTIAPFEVVCLLDDQQRAAAPAARAIARALDHSLDTRTATGPDGTTTVLGDARRTVDLGRDPDLGPTAGATARAYLAVRAVAGWERGRVPLIVSPSLAMDRSPFGPDVDRATGVALVLRATEDAALRMLRAEQAVTELRRRALVALDPGDRARHLTLAQVFEHPILTVDRVAAALAPADPTGSTARQVATQLLTELQHHAWLRPLDGGDTGRPTRWLAQPVIDAVTQAFAPHQSPRPPQIDLRDPQRSTHRVHTS